MNTNLSPAPDPGATEAGDEASTESGAAGPLAPCGPSLFGDVVAATGPKPCRFLFGYGVLPVTGELRLDGENAKLRLLVVVGRLPYTVESRDQREALLKIIKAFPAEAGESLVVSPDQLICVCGTTVLEPPVTPTTLVAAMVTALFRFNPVLETLATVLPDLAPAIPCSLLGNGPATGTAAAGT